MVEWTRRSLSRFAHVAGSRQAAAIAYYVLLSLFPLILFLASVAGLVLRTTRGCGPTSYPRSRTPCP